LTTITNLEKQSEMLLEEVIEVMSITFKNGAYR
jgi:hypothetical protein